MKMKACLTCNVSSVTILLPFNKNEKLVGHVLKKADLLHIHTFFTLCLFTWLSEIICNMYIFTKCNIRILFTFCNVALYLMLHYFYYFIFHNFTFTLEPDFFSCRNGKESSVTGFHANEN